MSASRGDTPPNLRSASPAHTSSHLQLTPSHEVLNAHPLLSPGPPNFVGPLSSNNGVHAASESINTAAPQTTTSANTQSATSTAPKYLPYTPRQTRVVTGSATTGTASSSVSVSPQQHHHPGSIGAPSATSRLQLQNLKAVAQHHGLDASCLGWAMLEELVAGFDHSPAWTEVWTVIAMGKATLLLPTDPVSSRELITPEFMKDHIIFCEGSGREKAPIVTLSGLRGTIDGNDLLIQSTIPTSSKVFKSLSDPVTRSSALSTLPPLPILSNSGIGHPKISCSSFISSLPLPPRTSLPPKPPLPPRPGAKTAAPHVSRLANPFASLFGKSPAPPSPAPTSQPLPDVPPVDHIVEVAAFTIDHPLIRRNVSKALGKCIKAEIKESLAGVPTWVIDRTQSFSSSFLPFPKPDLKVKSDNGGSQAPSDANSILEISAYDDAAEDVSQRFQDFYESLEQDLRVEGSPSTLRRRDDKHNDEQKEREKKELDAKVQNVLEKVESTLSSVFYDRLFRPSSSDDASHDEALSSRIAALNKLDLGLDHLGVDAGSSKEDVNRIVEACGQTISQLEVARCPADKAAILVASHRIIVDGLSRLPPLHLKSDEIIDDDKTPQAPNFNHDGHTTIDSNKEQSNSPTDMILSPIPMSPPKLIEDKQLEESTTTETIRPHLLEHSASTESIPSVTLSPAEESGTPLLSVSPPKTPTPVSGDILLPVIIFSVVKTNPPQLVSHLLYTQRFRNQSIGGEESYCLINLMAVVEFLENVDLGALGLKESEKDIMSTADLTPIPLSLASDKSPVSTPGGQAGLRGRVEQQVDALAGSANKVLSGVVDSGFGVLRSLLPTAPGYQANGTASAPAGTQENTQWSNLRPGFGLLRRESAFSIASLAASLPGAGHRERARSIASSYQAAEDDGQEMVESRPASIRNMTLDDAEEGDSEDEDAEDAGSGDDEEEEEDGEETRHDTRSIRSFESMMSERTRERQKRKRSKERNMKKERMSLTDRLAHMSRLTKNAALHSHEASAHQGSPPARLSTMLSAKDPTRFDTPLSSRTSSPVLGGPSSFVRLPPPSRRFLECTADDLKMSEIPELLNEYRRLVENMRAVGAFDEQS